MTEYKNTAEDRMNREIPILAHHNAEDLAHAAIHKGSPLRDVNGEPILGTDGEEILKSLLVSG